MVVVTLTCEGWLWLVVGDPLAGDGRLWSVMVALDGGVGGSDVWMVAMADGDGDGSGLWWWVALAAGVDGCGRWWVALTDAGGSGPSTSGSGRQWVSLTGVWWLWPVALALVVGGWLSCG